MGPKIKLSYVLPTFNEVDNLSFLFEQIKQFRKNNFVEFIFIDDNSTDGTIEYLFNQKDKFNNIRILKRIDDKGLSKSIKAGYLISKGEYVVVMDTDGQHEIQTTKNLLNKIDKEKLDIVIASRFLKGSKFENFPIIRINISKVGNFLSRISLSSKYSFLTDYLSGCFILKKQSCNKHIKQMNPNGFKFLYNLLSQSNGNLKVYELPFIFKRRQYGESKLSLYNVLLYFLSVLNNYFFIIIQIIKINLSDIYKQYLNKK